ncbi:MAG: 3-deoxy-D-manno-octulosonic acid transferase [bacterium]
MYSLYNLVLILFLLISWPFFALRMIFSRRWRQGVGERFGFLPSGKIPYKNSNNRHILIRAASVGEVKAIKGLIDQLREDFPQYGIVLSVVTPEGFKVAGEMGLADVRIFAPLDFLFCVRRVLRIFKPVLLVLVETELWPNLVKEAKKQGAKVIIVNGRISEKSLAHYSLSRPLIKEVLGYIDSFSMREEQDKARIISIGAAESKVSISGNIKYDQQAQTSGNDGKAEDFGLKPSDIVFVAGSTREGEEEIIVEAYKKVLKKFPHLKMILAPRHLKRVSEVEQVLLQNGLSFVKKTRIGTDSTANVILLDTMGDLVKAYALSSVAFVGGSLVPKGGQNIMEPAGLGKPVLFGPSMESFFETARLLKKKGAEEVSDAAQLCEKLMYFLSDEGLRKRTGDELRKAVISMRGATKKNMDLIHSLIR